MDILYSALAQVLIFFQGITSSWVSAIIVFTLVLRLILFPFFLMQVKSQDALLFIMGRVKEIQEEHKDDQEELARQAALLQKEHGRSLLGFIPLFVQVPILYLVYRVLSLAGDPTSSLPHQVTDFLPLDLVFSASLAFPWNASSAALAEVGASSLSQHLAGALLTALSLALVITTQWVGLHRTMKRKGVRLRFSKALLVLDLLIIPVAWHVPLGVLVYWVTSNFFSLLQQTYVLVRTPRAAPAEDPLPLPPSSEGVQAH